MKRSLILFLISLIAATAPSDIFAAEKRVFAGVANMPGVESVYVGPAALRLMGAAATMTSGMPGVPPDLLKSLHSIKSLEVLECSNPESNAKIKAAVKKIIDTNTLELILERKDAEESVRIYAYVPENSSELTPLCNLLIENSESDEYSVVYINGTLDIAELERMNDEE